MIKRSPAVRLVSLFGRSPAVRLVSLCGRSPAAAAFLLILAFMTLTFAAAGQAQRQYRVVLIDSGFNKSANSRVKLCADGHYDTLNGKPGIHVPTDGHGTEVAESFADALKPTVDACVIVVRAVSLKGTSKAKYIEAWRYVDKLKDIDAVSTSVFNHFGGFEFRNIVERVAKRVPVFTCAGNDSVNLTDYCNYFPACFRFPNLFVIGSGDPRKIPAIETYSNYGLPVTAYYPGVSPSGGQGTSFAAPRAMADYLNSLGK